LRLIHHTPRSRLCIWSSGWASPSEASLDSTLVPSRTKSFGCCLDPPQLRQQLAWGSKPLRGRTLARSAGEAPAVAISTASAHLLGASLAPRRTHGRLAAQLVHASTSVDQRPEKSLQVMRAFARITSGSNRGMPSKSAISCAAACCLTSRRSLVRVQYRPLTKCLHSALFPGCGFGAGGQGSKKGASNSLESPPGYGLAGAASTGERA